MDEEAIRLPRKRGAQPGNINAFKHGFYSRGFRNLELEDLQRITSGGVVDEIDMLRVVMRRVFDLATDECATLDSLSKAMTGLGKTSFHLGNLLRVQAALDGQAKDITVALSKALSEVLKELEA